MTATLGIFLEIFFGQNCGEEFGWNEGPFCDCEVS
jgi:hypothetical protein